MDSEVSQYEQQLSQIQQEISRCVDEEKRGSLIQLENDIKELISLTKGSVSPQANDAADDLDAEYALFKAELALDEENRETDERTDETGLAVDLNELQEDLQSLPGMKCQAPFTYAWGDEATYHNALVYKVETATNVSDCEDINVRVMFTNPTHKDMKPCPYYLDGECKFTEENCRFSHGEIVGFSTLKDFKEPDFTDVSKGSHVLVKLEDDLWHRATIINVSDDSCVVKVEASSLEHETHLRNILPLDSTRLNESDISSDESSDEGSQPQPDTSSKYESEFIVAKLLNANQTSALGEWEQYTKGFGSRIMARMGYIHGAGLGASSEGRLEPIPAVVYPSGKSLDHCMMLKEKAGGDQDLFKAERKMKAVQRKHQEALKRSYEREKQRKDVFTVLNETLGQSSSANSTPQAQKELRSESQKGLNVSSLRISDDVRKIEKEVNSLNKSLARHTSSSPAYAAISDKIRECERRLSHLHESERKIYSELQQRKDRNKLTKF